MILGVPLEGYGDALTVLGGGCRCRGQHRCQVELMAAPGTWPSPWLDTAVTPEWDFQRAVVLPSWSTAKFAVL